MAARAAMCRYVPLRGATCTLMAILQVSTRVDLLERIHF